VRNGLLKSVFFVGLGVDRLFAWPEFLFCGCWQARQMAEIFRCNSLGGKAGARGWFQHVSSAGRIPSNFKSISSPKISQVRGASTPSLLLLHDDLLFTTLFSFLLTK